MNAQEWLPQYITTHGGAAGDPQVCRDHGERYKGHFPVLREHDCADADEPDCFRRNLLREGVDKLYKFHQLLESLFAFRSRPKHLLPFF